MPVDMFRKVERVLTREAFRQVGLAALERLDDLQMVHDRSGCAIVLGDRRPSDGTHVDQEIPCGVHQGL